MTTQTMTRRVTAGAFAREAIEQLSRGRSEPEWLREVRLAAWAQADRLPFPTSRERAWKYLNPDRLALEGQRLAAGDRSAHGPSSGDRTPRPTSRMGVGAGTAGVAGSVTVVDGVGTGTTLIDDARTRGVIVSGLDEAVREHPDLVRAHLGTVVPAGQSVFTALNAALWTGGVFVYVPKDVRVELPLHALVSLTVAGAALFPRLLLVAERGAEVTFFDERSGGDGGAFVSSVTEVVLGDEARARVYGLQNWGPAVQELFFQRARLGRNAELVMAYLGLGASIHKGWIEADIRGTGARSEIYGAVLGTADQHFDVITLQDHVGEHSASNLLIKAALKDRALSAYYGLTRINPSARMADANQEDRNLLLSDKAKAEADPVLEILTSEVARCAHGASAGPVDQEQLFYLESRAIPRPQAETLVVQGFLGDVVRRVKDATVRERMETALAAKLSG